MDYRACWLTLNRACNLRCTWYYAKESQYSESNNMSLEMAKDIVAICEEIGIRHITLIGGEPTLYPYLTDVIEYCHTKKITCGIITNGLKLADSEYLERIIQAGQRSVSISIKGEDRHSFLEITGRDEYDTVIKSISSCLTRGMRVTVSMVLTEANIDSFLIGVRELKNIGVKRFHFSFCYEFDVSEGYKSFLRKNNPKIIARKFTEHYDELERITDGQFDLFESFPLCIWDSAFIKKLAQRKQIRTVCQLLHRSGLLFDNNGFLIPCNAMYGIKLGRLYQDFRTGAELIQYSQSDQITAVYDKLCSLPDAKCQSCKDFDNCGGGCVCHWTNYDYQTLANLEV